MQLKEDQGRASVDEGVDRPSSPNSDSEEQDSYEECCTVTMETKTLGPADQALQLWESVIAKEDGQWKLRCPDTTLDSLVILTAIFRMADRVSPVCFAVQLLTSGTCRMLLCRIEHWASSFTVQLCTLLQLTHLHDRVPHSGGCCVQIIFVH